MSLVAEQASPSAQRCLKTAPPACGVTHTISLTVCSHLGVYTQHRWWAVNEHSISLTKIHCPGGRTRLVLKTMLQRGLIAEASGVRVTFPQEAAAARIARMECRE